MSEKKLKTAYDYELQEIVISADRLSEDIDITNLVAQLDIFENLNRPFLTGNLVIVDNIGLMSSVNFVGTEKINVKLGLSVSQEEEPVTINKNFIMTTIKNSAKENDKGDTLSIELIEDSGYRNYLENVNRPYSGTGSQIIANCISEFLGKKLRIINNNESSIKPFKIIVPNYNPFDVVAWVKSLMVKEFGFPYYFYSVIHTDDIIQNDLLTMLRKKVVNEKLPYLYSLAFAEGGNMPIHEQSHVISSITFNTNVNTLKKVREGNVGSSTQQLDLIKNSSSREIQHFDIYQMFKEIKIAGAIKSTQSYLPYDNKNKINDKKLHDYDSRRISELQVSYIYDKNTPNSTDVVPIDQQLKAKAIKSWLQENKVTIHVPGRNFLETSVSGHTTLGDIIAINVFDSKDVEIGGEPEYNKKQSGEYIIQALRHMFVLDKYSVVAECVKLTDIENANEKLK